VGMSPRGTWCLLLSRYVPPANHDMAITSSGCSVVALASICVATSELVPSLLLQQQSLSAYLVPRTLYNTSDGHEA
jgi:hypothetical protein